MKAVILAGGFGTRLSEETGLRPKPLVEIGGKPIIWHIMKSYERAGIKDFVVCCGYKGSMLKHYFAQYFLEMCDISVDLGSGDISYLNRGNEDWKVTLIDTGTETMTGGRLGRVGHLVSDSTFCMTYGDGLISADINEIVSFHRAHGKTATVTAVPSPGRFGILELDQKNNVTAFLEKPNNEMGLINAGYFVLEPEVLSYVKGDATVWEREPLENLAIDGKLAAFRYDGFWKPMDTLRDKTELESMWASGKAPWK